MWLRGSSIHWKKTCCGAAMKPPEAIRYGNDKNMLGGDLLIDAEALGA